LRQMLAEEVVGYLGRRFADPRTAGGAGYSDGELARVLAAARADAAEIQRRLQSGEQLLARLGTAPDELRPDELSLARTLASIAQTGTVPWPADVAWNDAYAVRVAWARQLFLTIADLAPLMVLAVAATGRNPETVKELPATHRLLDDTAVELTTIKRRSGAGHWHHRATWEIGPPQRRLHTAGGLYLLLHQLTARSRAFSGSATVWSIWASTVCPGPRPDGEHRDPFAANLALPIKLHAWAARHGLQDDDRRPLQLRLGRLRTSVEVRRTKQVGGHLPSAARTNTMQTLFASYLRGDPTVIDWADAVLDGAFADA
jgi:hypothetical protein